MPDKDNFQAVIEPTDKVYVVRRLTPLECTRLQGYPDGWVDIGDWTDENGKVHKDSDSAKYKALGNSLALPFWYWMAERMVNVLKQDGAENPTMAGLFSGIGGFELVFARNGCKPIWSSEIDSFPIAVMKKHFGDGDNDQGDWQSYFPSEFQPNPEPCENSSGGGISGTLDASYYKGCGTRRGHEREFVVTIGDKDEEVSNEIPQKHNADEV